jgi:adenylylsulfate kinase-like enzyme
VPDVKVLVLSGSMGSGKTTILGEASDLLAAAGVTHAAIDLDWLDAYYLPATASTDASRADLARRNLAAVWRNYAEAGLRRLLIASALERREDRQRIAEAVPESTILVCRLRASLATMQARVRLREPGMLQERYVARVAELEGSLDAARVEDFEVCNDERAATDAAREVLARAGWL